MRYEFFKRQKDQPPTLEAETGRTVRFEEVDSLGIAWHGRYPSYFEDARVALGDKYGIGYMDFYRNKVAAPIKKMHVEYCLPLRFQEEFKILARLVWSEAARINHEFIIYNQQDKVVCYGYSVQMFVDLDGEFMLSPPEFYADFCRLWKQGKL